MTNKEIKQLARKNIGQNMGNCISLTAFLFAVFVFLVLCEIALYLLFERIGWDYYSKITKVEWLKISNYLSNTSN